MTWPNNTDGDVLRRLKANNFDFSKEYIIDFNVEFDNWPPAQHAIDLLSSKYANVEVVSPDEENGGLEEDCGYIVIQIKSHITYDFLITMQTEVTKLMGIFGGRCDSWGVLF